MRINYVRNQLLARLIPGSLHPLSSATMYEDAELEEYAPWAVLIITVVGGLLRVLLLGSKGLWLDEAFSVWMAGHGVGEMLGWVARIDQHPPLYYLLLHYWIALTGDTPYDVRLLSVLFGAAAIPVIYLIGKRMSGLAMGSGGGRLPGAVAVPHLLRPGSAHVHAPDVQRRRRDLRAGEAAHGCACRRPAAAPAAGPIGGQFRGISTRLAHRRAGRAGDRKGFQLLNATGPPTGLRAWMQRRPPIRTVATDLAWVAFIAFSVATLYSHNTAVFFPLAVNVFVLGLMLFQRRKKPAAQSAFQAPPGNWVKAQAAIFLLWLPWLFTFIRQVGAVYGAVLDSRAQPGTRSFGRSALFRMPPRPWRPARPG